MGNTRAPISSIFISHKICMICTLLKMMNRNNEIPTKFNVLPAVITNGTVLWHVTSYSLVKVGCCLGETSCLQLLGHLYRPIFNSGLLWLWQNIFCFITH